MEEKKSFFERWQNPAIWLTILASFWWFSQEIGMVRTNESEIDTVSERLDKKIGIQNEHSITLYEHEIQFLHNKLEVQQTRYEDMIEAMKERHRLELEILKLKIQKQ